MSSFPQWTLKSIQLFSKTKIAVFGSDQLVN